MPSPDEIVAARRWMLSRLCALSVLATVPRLAWSQAPAQTLTPDQILNVMDFEALARAALPPAHFAYIATGVDDDRTVIANHEAFGLVEIRSRRFVDVSNIDMSVRMFGVTHPVPFYLLLFPASAHFIRKVSSRRRGRLRRVPC